MNQILLVGEIVSKYEILYTKKELEQKLLKFNVRITRPFKNKEGNFDEDIINVKAWTNSIEDLELSLKENTIVAIKGRLQSFSCKNKDGDEIFLNDVLADRVNYISKSN